MRITHAITGLEPGGAEQTLYKLLVGGLCERWATQVISLTGGGAFGAALRAQNVSVVSLGMRRSRLSVSAVVAYRRALRQFKPRIIQGWMYHGNLAASIGVAGLRPRPALLWNMRHGVQDLAE